MVKTEKYFQNLYDLAALLNSARSPDQILKAIVENVTQALSAKGCSLMLLTPDKNVLIHTAAYGLSDWFVRKGPVSADKSMSESLKGKLVSVLDATTDKRIEYHKQVSQEGIASILSVPVKLRGEVVGVMRVYTSKPHRFSAAEVSFAEAAANFGAIALENTHFYGTLQTDYEMLRLDLRQQRAEVGYEETAEPPVVPTQEKGPIAPPGG
jgi:GAF domain-containing protein